MKILYANLPSNFNRFMADLKAGIEAYAEVVWDHEEFWRCENPYDVIHIHWPEYLSHEIQECTWNTEPIPQDLWKRTTKCLEYWKERSAIVYTRHVQYPHARHDQEFLDFYRSVTSYCDTVVHFANYSVRQFNKWYPEHSDVNHVVIPHHNYASLPNESSKIEARSRLGIDPDAKVMVVFGKINEAEKPLIDQAFRAVPAPKKVLLAPGWNVPRRLAISYIRLRDLIWKFEKWAVKLNRSRRLDLGFIPEDQAHLYLNAADVMLIPRTRELNSGNIALGCTFGLVVIGSDHADIGEILNETGNPTFKIGDNGSLEDAVHRAFELTEAGHGERNRQTAMKEWDTGRVSKIYIDVMKDAIARKFGADRSDAIS